MGGSATRLASEEESAREPRGFWCCSGRVVMTARSGVRGGAADCACACAAGLGLLVWPGSRSDSRSCSEAVSLHCTSSTNNTRSCVSQPSTLRTSGLRMRVLRCESVPGNDAASGVDALLSQLCETGAVCGIGVSKGLQVGCHRVSLD